MELSFVHLWPDAMNRNGSQGNLLCLRRRAEWRGAKVSVREIPVEDAVELDDCDLLYLGAGAPYENEALLEALRSSADTLRSYVEAGGVLLAVCEGLELLGEKILLADGSEIEGADALGLSTTYAEKRTAGNLVFRYGETELCAFENHAGCILLRQDAAPLGTVLLGQGNNTLDSTVGIRSRNAFGAHAYSLLPPNPVLADDILRAALHRKYPDAELSPLDDTEENTAREQLLRRLMKKE